MILFFGTRPGKAITKNLEKLNCPHCQKTGTLTATVRPNYFHLFWLPLFRVATFRFVECRHCKGAFYGNEFTSEIEQALKD